MRSHCFYPGFGSDDLKFQPWCCKAEASLGLAGAAARSSLQTPAPQVQRPRHHAGGPQSLFALAEPQFPYLQSGVMTHLSRDRWSFPGAPGRSRRWPLPARGPSAPHADPAARGHSSRTTRPLRAGTRTRQPLSRADGPLGVTRPQRGASGSVRLKGASMAPQPPGLLPGPLPGGVGHSQPPSWPRAPRHQRPLVLLHQEGRRAARGSCAWERPAALPPAGCCLSGRWVPEATRGPRLRLSCGSPPGRWRVRGRGERLSLGGQDGVTRPERHSESGNRGARARRAGGQPAALGGPGARHQVSGPEPGPAAGGPPPGRGPGCPGPRPVCRSLAGQRCGFWGWG